MGLDVTTLTAEKALEEVLLDHELWAQAKADVLKRMAPRFREIFDEGVAVAKTLDVPGYSAKDFLDPVASDLDDIAEQLFRNYTDDWWAQLERTTREGLRAAIIKSNQEGTGVRAVIRQIRPLFGAFRAQLIGVTETTRLFGQGAVAVYRASGLSRWTWRTVSDERVCPQCSGLAGADFSIETDFNPAHVSCRCFPSPVA